jgi:hypothetical protein
VCRQRHRGFESLSFHQEGLNRPFAVQVFLKEKMGFEPKDPGAKELPAEVYFEDSDCALLKKQPSLSFRQNY